MKTTLQKALKSIQYIAPGPAVSTGPGTPLRKQKKNKSQTGTKRENLAGIDISDGHICAAYFNQNPDGTFELQRAGSTTYKFHESEANLSRKVATLWKECEIPTHLATACLHTRSLSIKPFKYKGLTESDLESALRLEAEEAMQLPPNEVVFNWHINHIETHADALTTSGILVSAPARKVKQLIKILRTAGLYPALIDTVPTATSNLYLDLHGNLPPNQSIALLNLSRHRADICILYNGDNLYPRPIFSHSGSWNENTPYLIETLQGALLYFHVKIDKASISKILVTGDLPESPELLQEIERETQLKTERWNPIAESQMAISKTCKKNILNHLNQPMMTTCLGLALRREASDD